MFYHPLKRNLSSILNPLAGCFPFKHSEIKSTCYLHQCLLIITQETCSNQLSIFYLIFRFFSGKWTSIIKIRSQSILPFHCKKIIPESLLGSWTSKHLKYSHPSCFQFLLPPFQKIPFWFQHNIVK